MRLRSSLFVRIYVTFVVSVLGFALLAAGLVWRAGQAWNEERIAEIGDRIDHDREAILAALRQREQGDPAMRAVLESIETDLDADVMVHPHVRGRRFGPPHPRPEGQPNFNPPPPLSKEEYRQLRRGLPIVRRNRFAPPEIGFPLLADQPLEAPPDSRPPPDPPGEDDEDDLDPRAQNLVGMVRVAPRDNPRRGLVLVGLLLLAVLAGGAWPLARSLTHRLARLEKSTRSLARGEFSHRAEVVEGRPRDEIDRLALAFNDMADRLQAVLTGQQTLLANVSHELRTPIARLRVLVELLGERLGRMDAQGEITDAQGLARMRTGFTEMEEDLAEVDTLINDLLTSGRLELGRGNALQLSEVGVCELCKRAASRFSARVECPDELEIRGDALLLERLLRNLLANARRACPEGELTLRGLIDEGHVVIEVEDEGPGVPLDKRSLIFEPFARLDAARARDHGGVGLGLHLCRQIAAAHGGTLRAMERRDGRPGARFVLRL